MSFKISYTYEIVDKFTRPLKKIETVVKRVEARMAAFTTVSKKTENGLKQISKKAKTTASNFDKLARKVDKFNRAARAPGVRKLGSSMDDLRTKSNELRGELIDAAAVAFVFSRPIKEAMKFESAMADVKKVVAFKTPEQFEEMSKIIKKMGVSTSLGSKGIADIMAAGGRLGISPEMLPDFALTVAKASIAFDMLPGTAGDALASISNKMKVPLKDIESIADAVNHLSDTTAAKAPNMINILGRISGEMASIKMPAAAAAGLAAFADQVEVTPQLAASGVRMMITRMQRIPGMTKKMLADPQKTIIDFLKKLKGVSEEARPELIRKMFGDEAARFVRKAVAGLDLYQSTMDKVSDKTKFAGSMTKEFNIRMDTTEKSMSRAKAQIQNAGINIGSVLLPALVGVFGAIEFGSGLIAGFAEKFPIMTTVIMATVGGLIALRLATIAYMFASVQMRLAMAIVGAMAGKLSVGLLGVTMTTNTLKMAAKGLLRAFGIGLIIEGVVLLITHWETIWGIVKKVWDIISSFGSGVIEWITGTEDAEKKAEGVAAQAAAAQKVNMNGEISVTATNGAKVNHAGMAMDAGGDLGFNMGGA